MCLSATSSTTGSNSASCNSARLTSLACHKGLLRVLVDLAWQLLAHTSGCCILSEQNRKDHWLYDLSLLCTTFGNVVAELGLQSQGSKMGNLVEWQCGLWKICLFCIVVCCWYFTLFKDSLLVLSHMHIFDGTAISFSLPWLCCHTLKNTTYTLEQLSVSPAVQLWWAPKTTPHSFTVIR